MKTDAQLRNEVNDELEREPFSHTSNIEVDVPNAVVTLFGTVHSDAQKAGAESDALRVPGVMSLASDLTVFRDPMPLG